MTFKKTAPKQRARQLLRWEQAFLGRAIMLARRVQKRASKRSEPGRERPIMGPLFDWVRPRSRALVLT